MTRIAVLGAGLIGGVLARELASEGEFDVSVQPAGCSPIFVDP